MNNRGSQADVEAQCRAWLRDGRVTVARAQVRWSENWDTKQITVTGSLGIAPDEHTIILYPISISRFGHWGKTQLRREMAAVKRELIAAMKERGYWSLRCRGRIEIKSLRP